MGQAFYQRQLPHLQRDYRPHFVTFCTHQRWILPDFARQVVLDCCLHDNDLKMSSMCRLWCPITSTWFLPLWLIKKPRKSIL